MSRQESYIHYNQANQACKIMHVNALHKQRRTSGTVLTFLQVFLTKNGFLTLSFANFKYFPENLPKNDIWQNPFLFGTFYSKNCYRPAKQSQEMDP